MLRGRVGAAVLAAILVAAPAAPAVASGARTRVAATPRVLADEPPPNPDPCSPQDKGFCQQAPEAPSALLYPAAGFTALILFLALERRRRNRNSSPRA
jgi:hypothetical protein